MKCGTNTLGQLAAKHPRVKIDRCQAGNEDCNPIAFQGSASPHTGIWEGNDFTHRSGTSMAAPHVAGLAGLLISQDSSRNGDDVRTIITENVDDLGQEGKDWQFGHGRINAQKALSANGATPFMVDAEFELQIAAVDSMTHQFFLPLVVSP